VGLQVKWKSEKEGLSMETVAGIFRSRADAETAVQQLHSLGIPNDRIALLTPGTNIDQAEKTVPTADTEQPGMGKAMGGAVGGALGAASGATLGVAAASLLVPGVGPVLAGGILGAAILGAGGAVTGAAAGEALEEELVSGLPHDELYVYEDAVRKGRSVVIAFVESEEAKETARSVLASADAESIDAAREDWWLGLRDAEAAHYETTGRDFQSDEANYRHGFEAALRTGGAPGKDAETGESPFAADADEAFRRGYARGQAYCRIVEEKYRR
jgi:ADP-ribose pyrophosphatase YjhB (NUDIX family)